jgi:hypothetical protein
MITRKGRVVLIGLTVATLPVVKLAFGKTKPAQKKSDRNLSPVAPKLNKIDNRITGGMRNPESV